MTISLTDPFTAQLGGSEFCEVSAEGDVCDGTTPLFHCTRFRQAHTHYELHTGGKGLSSRQNLFVGSAPDTKGIGNVFYPEVDPYYPQDYPIAFTSIVLGGFGGLGNDGRVYKVLADNTTMDITPVVQGNPYYTFPEPLATKHKLVSYTLHPALTNTNRDRTTLGVGEEVSIYFDPELDMTFPETPWWLAFDGGVTPNVGSAVLFTAPSNAVPTTTVRVFVRNVQLDKYFTVVEPSGWDHADIVSTPEFAPGTPAAAMNLTVFFAPTDVSLYRVEIEEVGEDATDIWGAFLGHPPEHHTSDEFRGLNDDNSWKAPDQCQGGARYGYPGGFTWPIPANWRIPGGPTNPMSGWDQVFSIDEAGTYEIDKFDRWVRRTIDNVITTNSPGL